VTEVAEAKCRKLRKGNVAFSPILNATRLQVQAWNLVLCKVKGQKVSSRLISRSLKKANLSQDFHSYSSKQIQGFLKEAYKSYYEQKGHATSLRSTALQTLAEAIAEKGDKEKQRILKDLCQREQQQTTAKKLRFIRGKLRSGSTTMVTIQNPDGSRKDVTDRLEIEQAILRNNYDK